MTRRMHKMNTNFVNNVFSKDDLTLRILGQTNEHSLYSSASVCRQWNKWIIEIANKHTNSLLQELCLNKINSNTQVVEGLIEIKNHFYQKVVHVINHSNIDNTFVKFILPLNHNAFILEVIFANSSIPRTLAFIGGFDPSKQTALYQKYFDIIINKPTIEISNDELHALLRFATESNEAYLVKNYLKLFLKTNSYWHATKLLEAKQDFFNPYEFDYILGKIETIVDSKLEFNEASESANSNFTKYDKQTRKLAKKLINKNLEDAFQFYEKNIKNPFIHMAFLLAIGQLLDENDICTADKINARITDPYIKQHVQSLYVSVEFKDFLATINDGIVSMSYDMCREFEKNQNEILQSCNPECHFFVQSMLIPRYLLFSQGMERVEEIVKKNPQNHIIGTCLVNCIMSFCEEKDIQKAETLFCLLQNEREKQQAMFYINEIKKILF